MVVEGNNASMTTEKAPMQTTIAKVRICDSNETEQWGMIDKIKASQSADSADKKIESKIIQYPEGRSKHKVGRRRFDNLKEAGQVFLVELEFDLQVRMKARYRGAPPELIAAAAEEALRIGRRYDDVAGLPDKVLQQAMRTKLRHVLPSYDTTLTKIAALFNRDRVEGALYETVKAHFAAIVRAVAEELAQPGSTKAKSNVR